MQTIGLLLEYDIIDKLRVNTAIAWGQLASTEWLKIMECDVKSGQELVIDNKMWNWVLAQYARIKVLIWLILRWAFSLFCCCNALIVLNTALAKTCPNSNPFDWL